MPCLLRIGITNGDELVERCNYGFPNFSREEITFAKVANQVCQRGRGNVGTKTSAVHLINIVTTALHDL